MKKYILTPFPGEEIGEGVWHECTTWYELNVLYPRHRNNQGKPWALPTKEEKNND